MDVKRTRHCVGLVLAGLCLLPPASVAVGPVPREPSSAGSAVQHGMLGEPIAEQALSSLRGGEAIVVVSVDNRGEVSGNAATDVVSGQNRIDGGAFAQAAGLTTVIQNSGSNVLIQNGTAVNVRFGDPGP